MKTHRKLTLLLAGALAALTLGSIAWAAIPDGVGVINGCYEKQSGQLRVTEANAVVEYIRSTGVGRRLGAEDLERIRLAVQGEIDGLGAFVLDTRSALFTCRA